MKKESIICFILITLLTGVNYANAQEKDTSTLRKILFVSDSGLGGSVIMNVASFFFDGDYDVFSGGVGFGLSYKAKARGKNPFEIGFYAAPQFVGDGDSNSAFVSALTHVTLFQSFGVGVGYRLWAQGEGFVGPEKSNLFFTLGLGVTNTKEE